MPNPSLTELDLAMLAELYRNPTGATTLAQSVDIPPNQASKRLIFMVDNGLVRETDGAYKLTASGSRVLRTPGDESADDSIDAPRSVLWSLQSRGLRADRLDAVLATFAFLRYWGKATAAELKDGVFSEVPLEYKTTERWWREFVRDHLAVVPTIEPPPTESGFWRFTGTPGIADLNENGWRVVFGRGADTPGRYASATEAMVDMGLTDEDRLAVAAALTTLQREREADVESLRTVVTTVRNSDENIDESINDTALKILGRLPGVVRSGNYLRYTLTPDGYESWE
ncbi:hypothetical protein [Halococcus salifodinae]|uniref:Uncharacterized protein n=1 Tax=Halococcus salifodinae DSM 8989 TaxID=1227456 RepID=M0NA25_9EURY|nr:hypothetical protein [Halococcus salifodinae]EMA54817.1 hypothetical protein C450_04668 [Halococcus salifodinae DSM 8989]